MSDIQEPYISENNVHCVESDHDGEVDNLHSDEDLPLVNQEGEESQSELKSPSKDPVETENQVAETENRLSETENQLSETENRLSETGNQVAAPKVNGYLHGSGDMNGHESEDEEEYEIDPRDMMKMLEPQVDIIEEPDEVSAPIPCEPRQPSIFRRKRANNPKPVSTKCEQRSPERPRLKRRRMEEEDDRAGCMEEEDDRAGCRSLVCDSNGIIIAEMVFKCMICAHISDAISSAQKHYQTAHMQSPNGAPTRPQSSTVTNHAMNHVTNHAMNHVTNHAMRNHRDHESEEEDHEFENELELEAYRSQLNHESSFSDQNIQNDVPSNSQIENIDSNFSDSFSESPEFEDPEPGPSILKKPGNFEAAPTPPTSYVPGRNSKGNQSILGSASTTTSSTQGTGTTRGGYVTCAVCNITKYYASVQRRYGQFTCMGCAKFFGRFLIKPRRYFCPNLGSCPLETSPRCKACLLLACINTYVIDEKRMKIVNANRPIKKSASNPNSTILPSDPNECESLPQPQRQVTNPNNFARRNQQQESLTFAPPPLVKAPPSRLDAKESHLVKAPPSRLDAKESHLVKAPPSRLDAKESNNFSLLSNDDSFRNSSDLESPNRGVQRRSPAASPSSNRPNGSSQSSQGRKGTGCRQCVNCLADDCGKCNYCLDKPKFGGPNTLKKKCIQKKCLLIQTGGSVPRARVIANRQIN